MTALLRGFTAFETMAYGLLWATYRLMWNTTLVASSASYDLRVKCEIYRHNGVQESGFPLETDNACGHALCPVFAVQTPDAVTSSEPCVVQLS